ncbi:MAG: tetratricopeptide repeat protein [Thermodesulfovibrionales bacterium]|jgi:predicted O-linked N-acetylglucosamine transferase (SPINDLY family)
MDINNSIQLAFQHYQAGDLQRAGNICEKIVKIQPNNITAANLLGIICYQLKDYDSAIKYSKKLINLNPDNDQAYYRLAYSLEEKGEVDEAIMHYQKSLSINPNFAAAYYNLGTIFQDKRIYDEAISHYQKALQIDQNLYEAYYNLGLIFSEKGRFNEAIAYYQKALQINPELVDAYYNLGNAYRNVKQLDEAIIYYQKALQIDPYFANAVNNLGIALQDKGQTNEAIACFQKALELNPGLINTYMSMGNALNEQGKQEEAIIIYRKAILLNPHDFRARLAKCISQLPIIYSEQSHIQICRDHYFDELIKLQDSVSFSALENINSAADAVGSQQPFYLAYQGLNDRELQHFYGNLICQVMSLRYPQFAGRPAMPLHSSGEPLRIGFVSGFFRVHSNWKIPIRGWIENIDKKRFSLYGYYTGNKKDKATEDARSSFTCLVEDIDSFEELCRIIRDDNLHILIYPEIGMDSMSTRLASLRLSPIQCTSWGHPDTSGLPTIDYFLSSDLMEPADADDHYTEKLIRLPNLSIYYTPLDFPPSDINRETFGIHQKSVLYLCCQSLFKYLPQYDEVYPRIAKEVGDCQFLFISHKSNYVTERFRQRIYKSFEKFGLRADNYIVFLPRLDISQYNAINSLSDIYLDSIGWSGCNSTFEAIAYNLPIVTLPGELMRGRHTSAILTIMGVTETIASSQDEYLELAVRLGVDSEWRKQISEKIAANKNRVYRDKRCITALEDFLEHIVKEELK